MYTCKYCGKSFEKQQHYASHVSRCDKRPEDYKSLREIANEKMKNIKTDDNMYVCQYCGKKFEKPQPYSSHTGKCKLNPNRMHSLEHLAYARSCKKDFNEKDLTEYTCQYCGKVCIGKNSLTQHEIRCKNNPNRIISQNFVSNFIKYNEDCRKGVRHHPHKGKNKYNCESLKKSCETKRKQIEEGTYVKAFLGKTHTEAAKEKMRKSTLNYLKECKDFSGPRYNKKSIEYINSLNERMGWNLQHAENGGEYEFGGYYVDGYDKERNIIFEYDEPRHYKDVENNILIEKDIERQNYLINKLNCTFYRYNQEKDLLYKI
jgi:hypothetical protein